MWWLNRAVALASLAALGACGGWSETVGDFNYNCANSFHPLDAPHCEHRLTDSFLLRYGEGSGDEVVLAYEIGDDGSAALINESARDSVAQLGLDDEVLVVRLRSGRIFVAPARATRPFDIVGPLSEEEFAARYPNAPPWREVQ
jgi:hypothetical protein